MLKQPCEIYGDGDGCQKKTQVTGNTQHAALTQSHTILCIISLEKSCKTCHETI